MQSNLVNILHGIETEYDIEKNEIRIPYYENFFNDGKPECSIRYIVISPMCTNIYDFDSNDFRYFMKEVSLNSDGESFSIHEIIPTNDEKRIICRIVWNYRNVRLVHRFHVSKMINSKYKNEYIFCFDSYDSEIYSSIWKNKDGERILLGNVANSDIKLDVFKKIN